MESDERELRFRILAVHHRKNLERVLTKGCAIARLTRNYKLKPISIQLIGRGSGLSYTPPCSRGNNTLLFSDITEVNKLRPGSSIHRKGKLSTLQYVLHITTRQAFSWYLVLSTMLDFETWHDLLLVYMLEQSYQRTNDPVASYIANEWTMARRPPSTTLGYSEVISVLLQTFGDLDASVMAQQFKACDRDKSTCLTYEEFSELFHHFAQRRELQQIFQKTSSQADASLSREEFRTFLLEQDHEEASNSYIDALVSAFGPPGSDRLSFQMFSDFLVDARVNSIVSPRHSRCEDPMNLPLTCYFINSSHNTYLTGDQLTSDSSTDMYRDVLQRGCRCVEVDCWDGPNGEPIVYHGHTATSKIMFEDVIRVVKQYAFKSPFAASGWNPLQYPVILSLEVHTSKAQTLRMASILRNILQDKLLLPSSTIVYSPEALREKILVKWKMETLWNDDDAKAGKNKWIPKNRIVQPSENLSACATIGSIKTANWGNDAFCFNVQSYVEGELESISAAAPVQFIQQNTRMLSRVYPAGLRVASSNYDPAAAWSMGVHMVALNFQSRSISLSVNNGFFGHQNGGCGYVLKPLYLREVGASHPQRYKMHLRVLSGSLLGEVYRGSRTTARYVRIWIHGQEKTVLESLPVVGNSFHPVFDAQLSFLGESLDLDVLCIRGMVSDANAKREVFEANIPVRVLRVGYRAVPLFHPLTGSRFNFASLFCHLSVERL